MDVRGYNEQSELRVTAPYAALEAFEADNQSRLFYRVSTLQCEMMSVFAQLPFRHGSIPVKPPYAALFDLHADGPGAGGALGSAGPVATHEWMLGELLRNLLHNAIRHTPDGGALAVHIVAIQTLPR